MRFRLPAADRLGMVRFGWSPLFEASLSLRCIAHPQRYPLHLPWARRCRDLSPALQEELRLLTSGFDGFVPGVFDVGLSRELGGFHGELGALQSLDDDVLAWELSLGFGGVSCSSMPHTTDADDSDYQQQVLAHADSISPAHGDVARQLFDDPSAMGARLARMMEQYWDEAFADEWERILPRIEAEVSAAARELVIHGVPGLVEQFLPEATWDGDGHTISIERQWDGDVRVAERGGLLLVPTVYAWPHVLVEMSEPWPLSIMFPLRDLRQPEVAQASDHEVAVGLRALGDETRLQITRLVAEEPRSTRELAELLSLSDSAVSRHLQVLSRSGILDSHRDGYFVLYQLVPERIGALGGALRRTLGLAAAPGGPVPRLPVSVPRMGDRVGSDSAN